MVEMCMIGIENEECVEEDSSTSMLWRNTDIYDSFPKILPRNSQDERNYMMKYETWRFWPNRVKDLPWCIKTLTFQKDACFIDLGQPDISIALSWHVQLSTNLTDKNVTIMVLLLTLYRIWQYVTTCCEDPLPLSTVQIWIIYF